MNCLGQSKMLDSLISELNGIDPSDSSYVDLANEIAFNYILVEPGQTMYYTKIAFDVANKIGYKKGKIRALTNMGNSYLNVGLPDQALSHYLYALSSDAEQFPYEFVRLHNNIGEVFRRQELYDSSFKYFSKALGLVRENFASVKPVIILSNLGEVSLKQKEVAAARRYFYDCLTNSMSTNHQVGVGYGYFGLAECYAQEMRLDSAIAFQRRSIAVRKESNHQRGLIQSFMRMGQYYEGINADSSVLHWKKAVSLAENAMAFDLLNDTYEIFYNFYLSKNEVAKAAFYLQKNQVLGDSLMRAEYSNKVLQIEAAIKSELLSNENQTLREEQARLILSSRSTLILIVSLALLVIGGLTYYFLNSRRKQEISAVKNDKDFTETLLSLSGLINRSDFDFEEFINQLLRNSRRVLNCDRATYWQHNTNSNRMELKSINEEKATEEVPTLSFEMSDYKFLEELFARSSAVDDLSKNEKFSILYNDYFKPAKIKSLLNSFITIDAQLYGFISFAMRNDIIRSWNNREELFVSSLNDLITIAIAKSRALKLEKEKGELISKLQIKNKSLQEFNNVVSHNLREPLTQIIGFSSLLRSDNIVENSKELAEHVTSAANKIDTVVKELSTVLNEDDPSESEFQNVILEKLVAEVSELFKSELDQREVAFALDLSEPEITTYKPFLVDILYHLLSNSLKFSDHTKKLTISIKSQLDGEGNVNLSFIDNGFGIDLEKFGEKAFKMYQRYHLDIAGRGIGLFIVRNRVVSLGGSISWMSEEGKGSTFIVNLPGY